MENLCWSRNFRHLEPSSEHPLTDAYESVDPFLGNWEADMSPRTGLAARWFLPKALVGNTHPGAVLPLGMVSALPYSGGYVTGYGPYEVSCSGLPRVRPQGHVARGVTHFHHSGTGTVGHYYNYARVAVVDREKPVEVERPLLAERARPGYYAGSFGDAGPRVELTVTRRAALHRYAIADPSRSSLRVDLSSAGLDVDRMRQHPTAAKVRLLSPRRAEAEVHVDDIRLFVAVELLAEPARACLFHGLQQTETPLDLTDIEQDESFGLLLALPAGQRSCELRLGFSYRSIERAHDALAEIDYASFDDVLARAEADWREHLDAFEVETDSPEDRTKFYSALYHSLVKPVSARDDSPLWPADGPCMLDLCTLWDQYKTLYPMLMSVYPNWGRELVASLLQAARQFGCLWRAYLACPQSDICSKQASGLGHITLADAFFRLPDAADWSAELDLICESLFADDQARTFRDEGLVHPISHTLDLSEACFGISRIAAALGDARADELARLAGRWRGAFDPRTGLVVDSTFYEGSRWTYSFRPLHDMTGRIDLTGGPTRFTELLGAFFGYGADPVRQLGRGEGASAEQGADQRFEGLNNETDMETPYAWLYAGRHDRTCEVVHAVRSQQFRTGRNGLPGNDDSGGLSSWYVWAAAGLFPVAGQPLWLIGTPGFDRTSMRVAGGRFDILANGRSDQAIYVASAKLNGQPLNRAWLRPSEVFAGGTLELALTNAPTRWASDTPPRVD